MVRGNWQRRVEQAEARRAERKEWKLSRKQEAAADQQQRGGRRYYEELFVNYLKWLEQQQSFHDEKQKNKLYIWVNKKPKSSPEIDTGPTVVKEHGNKHVLQDEDQDHTKGKKGGGGRGKKKNIAGGKQQHPRSHAAAANSGEGGGTKRDAPSFCRPYFFYGTCCHGDETHMKSPSSKKGNRRKQHDDDSLMISQCCHGLLHSTFPLSDALSKKASSSCISTASSSNIKLSYQSSLVPKGATKTTARMRMSSFGSEGDDNVDAENDTALVVDNRMELLYHMSIPLTVGPITTGTKKKKASRNKSDHDDDDDDDTMEDEEEEEHHGQAEDDNDDSSSSSESSSELDHRKKKNNDVPNKTDTTTSMLVQRMEHALREEDLSFSNVVYATCDGCLSYDRYRGGNLLEDVGSNTSSPSKDNTKCYDRKHSSLMNDQSNSSFVGIPIPVDLLEFILGFLPSRYAGIMSMVCQSYAHEIGTLSPHLWKHYIRDRHHWPLTSPSSLHDLKQSAVARTNNNKYKDHYPLDDEVNNANNTDTVVEEEALEYRHLFVSHFEAVKLSEEVAMALQQTITSQRGTTTNNSSSLTAYQVFKSTKDAPDPENACVSMKFWNDPSSGSTTEPPRTKCICAFSRDGTIRAYETVPSSTSSSLSSATAAAASNDGTAMSAGPSVVLRQTVIARAMPLVRDSTLIAMDLDDTYIACLSHVPDFNTVDDELPPVKCVLTFASLNNFWSSGVHGASSSTQVQQTKHIFQDVSIDELIQHHLIHTLGYNPNNFFVNLSRTIISCGLGYFMMDVSVVFRQGSDEANPYWRKQYIALLSCSTPNEFVLFEDLSKIFGEHGHLLLTSRRVANSPPSTRNKNHKTSASRSSSCSTMIVAREETPSFRGVSMLITIDKTGVSLEMSAPFGATTEDEDGVGEEGLFRVPEADVDTTTRTFLDSTLCDIVPSCDYVIHVSNNVRTLPNGTAYVEATISFDRLSSLLLFSKESQSKSLPGGASQQRPKKDETLLLEDDEQYRKGVTQDDELPEQQQEVALPTISMKHCYICQIIALGNDHVMTIEFLEHLEDTDDQPRTNDADDGRGADGHGHGDHEALTTSTANETAATVAATAAAAAGMNDNSQMVVAGEGTNQNREDELEEVLEEEENEFDGQWFMIDDRHIIDFGGADPQRRGRRAAANGGGSKYAISVYHISSGQRLERIIMPSLQPSSIQFIVASGGTSTNSNSVGVAPIGHGLVISGLWDNLQWNARRQQQRAAGVLSGSGTTSHVDMDASGGGTTSTPQNKNTKKKKKKKLASMAKGRNKDGFARGMSVRG